MAISRLSKVALLSLVLAGTAVVAVNVLPNFSASAEETLFQDTFESGIDTAEWQPFLNDQKLTAQQWYWENGKVKFESTRGGKEAHDALLMHANEYWTDYTVEVDVKGLNAGLWFRGQYKQSSENGQWIDGYYFVIRADKAKLWEMQTVTNCTTACANPGNQYDFTNPQLIADAPFTNDPTKTYRIKVVLSGSNIKAYVDNKLYIEANDSDFSSGTIGFKTYKDPAEFDNVVITGTAGTDATPPVCGDEFDQPLKSFAGVRMFVKGSAAVDDPESGIQSGSWRVTDGSGATAFTMDTLDGYITDLQSAQYHATLTVTNGAGQSKACTRKVIVYSPEDFTGTVKAEEVDDYVIPSYSGPLYADNNPKRAVIVSWPGRNNRFVFWHESAYEPHWEFPNGAGMKYQFFEGAHGSGELLNKYGRMDKNSYPEIIQDDDKLAIVKWWYYDVNLETGDRAAYAEEYFYFFPNGLVLREMELQWGESFEPMEMIMINPVSYHWWDTVEKVGSEYHMSTMVDINTGEARDHWAVPTADINRAECRGAGASDSTMEAATGILFRSHYKDYVDPFILYGNNSFVVSDDIKQLCDWKYPHFVHGNIGWINSEWKKATPQELDTYPTCTPLLGANHEGYGPYYWLIGASDNTDAQLSQLGQDWLASPYLVPCSTTECTLKEPPSIPDTPPGDDDDDDGDTWVFNEQSHICRKTASTTQGTRCSLFDTPIDLKKGWNVIALPADLAQTTTAWLHMQSAASQAAIGKTSIWTRNYRFEGTTYADGELYGNDVDIASTTPVFAHVTSNIALTDFPYPYSAYASSKISWHEGWNAVVLRKSHVSSAGQQSDAFLKDTLPQLIGSTSYNVLHVAAFDADNQKWQTAIRDNGENYGDTYTVYPDRGYLIFLGT